MNQRRNIFLFFYLVMGGFFSQVRPLSCAEPSIKNEASPYIVDRAHQVINESFKKNDTIKKYTGSVPISDYILSIPEHISWAWNSIKNIFSGIAHRNSFLDYHLQKGTMPSINPFKSWHDLKWKVLFVPEKIPDLIMEIFDHSILQAIADLYGAKREYETFMDALKKWLVDVSKDAKKQTVLEQELTQLYAEIVTYLKNDYIEKKYVPFLKNEKITTIIKSITNNLFSHELQQSLIELWLKTTENYNPYQVFLLDSLQGNKNSDYDYYLEHPAEFLLYMYLLQYTEIERKNIATWMECFTPHNLKIFIFAKEENEAALMNLYQQYLQLEPLQITSELFLIQNFNFALTLSKGMIPLLSKIIVEKNKELNQKLIEGAFTQCLLTIQAATKTCITKIRKNRTAQIALASQDKEKEEIVIIENSSNSPIWDLMGSIKDAFIVLNKIAQIVPPEYLEFFNIAQTWNICKNIYTEITNIEKEKSFIYEAPSKLSKTLDFKQEILPGFPTIAQLFWKIRSGILRDDPEILELFKQEAWNEDCNYSIIVKTACDEALTEAEAKYDLFYMQFPQYQSFKETAIEYCKNNNLEVTEDLKKKLGDFSLPFLIHTIDQIAEGNLETSLPAFEFCSAETKAKIDALQVKIKEHAAPYETLEKAQEALGLIQEQAKEIKALLEEQMGSDPLDLLQQRQIKAYFCQKEYIEQINDVEILLKRDHNLPYLPLTLHETLRLLLIEQKSDVTELYQLCKNNQNEQKRLAVIRERYNLKQNGLCRSNVDLLWYFLNQNNERDNTEGLIRNSTFRLSIFEKVVIVLKAFLPEIRTLIIEDPEEAFKSQLTADLVIIKKLLDYTELSIDEEIIYRLNQEYFERLFKIVSTSTEHLNSDTIIEYINDPKNNMLYLKQQRMARFEETCKKISPQVQRFLIHIPKIISTIEYIHISPENRKQNNSRLNLIVDRLDNVWTQALVHWNMSQYQELYDLLLKQIKLIIQCIEEQKEMDPQIWPTSSLELFLDELHHAHNPNSPTKKVSTDTLTHKDKEYIKEQQEYLKNLKEFSEKTVPANNLLLAELPLTEQVSVGITPYGTKKLLYDAGKIYIESKIDQQVDAFKKRKIKERFFKDRQLLHLIQNMHPEVKKNLRKTIKTPSRILAPKKYTYMYALQDKRPQPAIQTTFLNSLRQFLYGKKPQKYPHKTTSLEKLRNYFDESLTPIIDHPLQIELVKHLVGKWFFNRVVLHFERDIVGASTGVQAFNKEGNTYTKHEKAVLVPGNAGFFSSLGTLIFPRLSLFLAKVKTKQEIFRTFTLPHYEKMLAKYIPESIFTLSSLYKNLLPEELLIATMGNTYLYSEYIFSTIIFEAINSLVEYMLYDKLSARSLALYFQKNLDTLEEILEAYQEAAAIRDPVGIKYAERRFFKFVEKSKVTCNMQNVILKNMSNFFLAYNMTSRFLFNQGTIKSIADGFNTLNNSNSSIPRLLLNGGLLATMYGLWKIASNPVKNIYVEFNNNN
jgi:hypothetical protein